MDRRTCRAWVILAVVTIAGLTLDLVTKQWAEAAIARGKQIRVLGSVVSLVLVHNKGALFGINPQRWLPGLPLNLFFGVFTVFAVAVILLYFYRVGVHDRLVGWGLTLVLPGALGNLFDRIMRADRGVVDFIMVDLNVWPADPWPVFNVADIFVTCGIALLLASVVRDEFRRKAPAVSVTADGG